MTKIKALNYLFRVINMKRLRDKNNHRYNQEKKDIEVMAALQEIKKDLDKAVKLENALFEVLGEYYLDEHMMGCEYRLKIVGTDYDYEISKETYKIIKEYEE